MSKRDRIGGSIILLVIISVVTMSFSRVFSYFKEVTDAPNLYAIGADLLGDHDPKITWLPDDPDIKGEMNKYLRAEIEKAYGNAWGILNLSKKERKDLGLVENFSQGQVDKIVHSFNSSKSINREDLLHNLQLHFVSLDKKIISFSDHSCISHTTIQNNNTQVSIKDTSDYKIVMTLDDGKWRVNKFIRV